MIPATPADKPALRKAARKRRQSLPTTLRRIAARRIARHLLASHRLRGARCVAAYLPMAMEVDTAPIIAAFHAQRRCICVPCVQAKGSSRMGMAILGPRTILRRGAFGIPEPIRRQRCRRIDLVLLPLLAFDASGTRLGSGAGYYDRWLARQRPRPLCIGLAFAAQEMQHLPREPWDMPLHAVCTERGIQTFQPHRGT